MFTAEQRVKVDHGELVNYYVTPLWKNLIQTPELRPTVRRFGSAIHMGLGGTRDPSQDPFREIRDWTK